MDHFIGGGVALSYPEVWSRFIGQVPEEHRHDVAAFYLQQMQADDERTRERYCYEWARYELSLVKLDPEAVDVEDLLEHYNYRSLAPLEAHYVVNKCFLPEHYIIDNAGSLANIPTSIVHGRYDVICPPRDAYALHLRLPGSALHFVCAGHAAGEAAISEKLVEELERFATMLR